VSRAELAFEERLVVDESALRCDRSLEGDARHAGPLGLPQHAAIGELALAGNFRRADAAELIQKECSQIIPVTQDLIWIRKKNVGGVRVNWSSFVSVRSAWLG